MGRTGAGGGAVSSDCKSVGWPVVLPGGGGGGTGGSRDKYKVGSLNVSGAGAGIQGG